MNIIGNVRRLLKYPAFPFFSGLGVFSPKTTILPEKYLYPYLKGSRSAEYYVVSPAHKIVWKTPTNIFSEFSEPLKIHFAAQNPTGEHKIKLENQNSVLNMEIDQ